MLFNYPLSAPETYNWIHNTLIQIIKDIHKLADTGVTEISWPSVIPTEHRKELSSKTSIKDSLIEYYEALLSLEIHQRLEVMVAIDSSCRIKDILSNKSNCITAEELPEKILDPLKKLFRSAFNLLKSTGIRKAYYGEIHAGIDSKVCPFCGCEYFGAPIEDSHNEDLDHYLLFKLYPFAGVNLYNLVPMGNKCNTLYKGQQNIIFDDSGRRRKVFYPFEYNRISISLDNSIPFKGKDKMPQWVIEFTPSDEETETWDSVFKIRERYKNDILDVEFNPWIESLKSFARSRENTITNKSDLIELLTRYITYFDDHGYHDRSFIKAAVFKMLLSKCYLNDRRMIAFLLSQFGIHTFP